MITTTRTAAAAARQLDELYAGNSGTYDAGVARYGRYLPETVAARVAFQHGTTLDELDTELYWGGVTNGAGTTVHLGSLLAALGY